MTQPGLHNWINTINSKSSANKSCKIIKGYIYLFIKSTATSNRSILFLINFYDNGVVTWLLIGDGGCP